MVYVELRRSYNKNNNRKTWLIMVNIWEVIIIIKKTLIKTIVGFLPHLYTACLDIIRLSTIYLKK